MQLPMTGTVSNLTRGLIALPLYLAFSIVAYFSLGVEGVGIVFVLAIAAAIAGYIVGSWWALLIAAPITLLSLYMMRDMGPLGDTSTGWGLVVLIFLALPIAWSTAIGVALRLWQISATAR